MIAMAMAATDFATENDPSLKKSLDAQDLQIGFEGSFGSNSVSPRGLNSTLLNNLVELEGIVTKCSSVRPKLVKSVHSNAQGQYSRREYRDQNSLDIGIQMPDGQIHVPTITLMPTKDGDGKDLETEHGLCEYKDYQLITLQERPENSKVGQLPRSVELILEHDLVDHVKPGDRVQCIGIYRPRSNMINPTSVSSVFPSHLLCNNISIVGTEVGGIHLSETDIKNIQKIADRGDILEVMGKSLCPSIYGHEKIKKALILLLMGGVEKTLTGGGHLRGDINCMMVGDPSTAKSQLLRAVMDIAPQAISSTGRGSSGVGLTAAVCADPETGEKRLEAGAMVLADRGVVCIDEFDKMGENDRVAIHEVMEQQTVTIAKAGIHASLNARCSVVAAANPIYGQYDKSRRPQENIGLPDSLLSRFDLLFIVLDQLDPVMDRTLSEHVIKSHQYRRPGTIMEPEALNQESVLNLEEQREQQDTPMWQRGASSFNSTEEGSTEGELLTKDFLKKYIFYAKEQAKKSPPVLTDETIATISEEYSQMRARSGSRNLPVTARTLETIIRLASAHAKARLSDSIEQLDAAIACQLLNFCLFHDTMPAENDSGSASNISSNMSGSNGSNDGGNDDGNSSNGRKHRYNDQDSSSQKRQRSAQDEAQAQVDENNANLSTVMDTNMPVSQTVTRQTVQDALMRLCDHAGEAKKHVLFGMFPLNAKRKVDSILNELEEETKVRYSHVTLVPYSIIMTSQLTQLTLFTVSAILLLSTGQFRFNMTKIATFT
jgi:DNA replication licensing factor MCM3